MGLQYPLKMKILAHWHQSRAKPKQINLDSHFLGNQTEDKH